MRVTLITEDNRVNVEGFSETVDLTELVTADVHVVQWYGDKGEIEYWNGRGAKEIRMPLVIDDFSPYQKFVDAWEIAARAA